MELLRPLKARDDGIDAGICICIWHVHPSSLGLVKRNWRVGLPHTLADRGGGGASAIGGAERQASGNLACAGRGEAGGGDGEAKRHVTRPHDVITCPVVDLARAAEGGNGGAAGHAWLNAALPPPNGRRRRRKVMEQALKILNIHETERRKRRRRV